MPKVKAKPQLKDRRSGVPIGADASLLIRHEKDAEKVVTAAADVQDEIARIRAENDLGELEGSLKLYREALRDYQTENEIVEVRSGGFLSSLVERRSSFWVWDGNDIPAGIELENDVVPLSKVLRKKFRKVKERTNVMRQISRRVINPAALDDAVKTGILAQEDVADSLAEYVETSYVQIKQDKK